MTLNRRNPLGSFALAALTAVCSAGFARAGEVTATPDAHGHSHADGHSRSHRRGELRDGLQRMLRSLDLTDTQKTEIHEILQKNRTGVQPLVDDVVSARLELNEAIQAPTPSERAIRAATERMVKAQTAIALERARIASEVRALLSPDQQKEFDAQRTRMREETGQRVRQRRSEGRKRLDDDSSSRSKDDDSSDAL